MIKVMIQVAAGSSERYYYNEQTLEYLGTRPGNHPYPYSYGFVIGTRAEDGDCVDCYLLTKDPLKAGTIVECEPVGLLLQYEGSEIDHKILATLPGQANPLGDALLHEMRAFILAIFSEHPEMLIGVGPILPREAALQHLQETAAR